MRRACATIIRRGSPWEGPMSSEARFRIEARERVAALWIDNPPRNLLRLSMISELPGLVEALEKDEWSRLAPKEAQEAIRRGQDALWALEHLTKPTIAALAGVVRGAGTELALACDLRIADESAVFSHPEVDLGWMPSHGGTARLSRLVGRSKALEILLAGKEVKALDALRMGIVDHLSAPDKAFEQASALADVFAQKPRASVKAVKRVLTEGDEKPYRNRFLLESQHAVQLLWSDDYRAAMERLRERRPK